MRDELPKKGPRTYETAIINLDSSEGLGTHWVCYKKIKNRVYYFDSFGNLKPPSELAAYFGRGSKIYYNHVRYQNYDTFNCGHLCLEFLYNI